MVNIKIGKTIVGGHLPLSFFLKNAFLLKDLITKVKETTNWTQKEGKVKKKENKRCTGGKKERESKEQEKKYLKK